MKPITMSKLEKALIACDQGRRVLAIDIPEQAARLAYQAMFDAAQALIFERLDRLPKTHNGVHQQFHDVARREAGLDARLSGDLSAAYLFKQRADYGVEPVAPVTTADAQMVLDRADAFVDAVARRLKPPP